VFVEVAARCGLGAVQTVTEIDLVQVQLENLFLGVRALDPLRDNQLLELAANRLIRRQKALTRELLRERAPALRDTPVTHVGQRRRADTHEVESVMVVKPLVFNVDEGLYEIRRDLGERHFDPLLLEDGEGELILAVKDARRLIHDAHLRDGIPIGKPLAQPADRPDCTNNRQHDRKCKGDSDASDDARVLESGAVPLALRLI
jgi:hypothetical protein